MGLIIILLILELVCINVAIMCIGFYMIVSTKKLDYIIEKLNENRKEV